jgi:N-acetyl-S-(2-succino)cysteine monooxygenase
VFTAQKNMADAQRFYRTVKEKVAEYGRVADEIVILPGFSPIVGSTEHEAKQIEQDLADLQVPEFGLHQLSTLLEVNLTGYPLDEPLPELPTSEAVNGVKSRYELVLGTARSDGLTVRQLLRRLGGGRGHFIYAGTPEQIANELQRWFEDRAADGFNIMPSYLPGGLDDFVDHVVPELQRRGLFRREYAGSTLRDHYGLPRPSNQFAARRLVS